ncbi:uncharacterized protein LOC142235463 [Haematobia irritans]|uniref:uncharacterized protein LOC142235463 n=1 Tax=Haematobia irritans TaxID=7368 RepID=UPI003F4FC1A2
MRSDNGKNFVGANEEAKRFGDVFEVGRIQDELSAKGIQWLFNCPINPSEGGVWERMVQCVKKVLRITLKETSPKEHILHSLLIEAQNIINSRPLTHLPVVVDSEEPLTPNHFLIGYGNVAQTPTIDEPDEKLFALRKQWRILKSLRDRFWKRWVLEYLPTLTRRVKWCERATPIKQNDVVFVCDPSLQRSRWCRGIVAKVYTGADGVARRADVKTAIEEQRTVLSEESFVSANGSTLIAANENKVTEYKKVLTVLSQEVTQYMVAESLKTEQKKFLGEIRQSINEEFIDLDIMAMNNNNIGPGDTSRP